MTAIDINNDALVRLYARIVRLESALRVIGGLAIKADEVGDGSRAIIMREIRHQAIEALK